MGKGSQQQDASEIQLLQENSLGPRQVIQGWPGRILMRHFLNVQAFLQTDLSVC